MIGRRILSALLVAVAATSCAIGSSPPTGGGGITIDVPEPDLIDWRRIVAGFEVRGSGTDADDSELALLDRALQELPPELVAAAGVRRFYRVSQGDSRHGTAAYALGPDIYLIDETFRDLDAGMTTFDLVRLLAHEMTHTAQFAELTDTDLERIRDRGIDDPIPSSDFVASFADATGWSDRGRASGLPDWTLTDRSGTTVYGATAPEEDMAESVADVTAGTGPEVSPIRARWVAEWLGTTAERLTGGRPWAPAGSLRIVSAEPLYDVAEVERRATSTVEVVSYSLPLGSPTAAELSSRVASQLAARGVVGSLAPVNDDRVARLAGFFTRSDGVGYWVELWDFRDAPGYADPPDTPVLTYVVLWR